MWSEPRSSQISLNSWVFRADVLTKFTILIIRFKHDNNFGGSTLALRANLRMKQWTPVTFGDTAFTWAWNPDFRPSIDGAPSVVHPINFPQSSSFTKFQKFSDKDWIWIFKKFIRYSSGVKKSISAHLWVRFSRYGSRKTATEMWKWNYNDRHCWTWSGFWITIQPDCEIQNWNRIGLDLEINSTGSDMDIQTSLITAVKCLSEVFPDISRIGLNICAVQPDLD